MFSYLKRRRQLEPIHWWDKARMSLELNFVNHILPTAGVSGASYMTWRLNKLGYSSARATLAQVVRLAASFLAYVVLLMFAVLFVALDTGINRLTILVASGLVTVIIVGLLIVWYIIDSESRLENFTQTITNMINSFAKRFLRKKSPILEQRVLKKYLFELREDYQALRREPRVLIRPFLWGLVFNVTEVSLFFFSFLALGTVVNPAAILLAIGAAAIIGAFLITPGGAGGYEAIMVLVLTSSGVNPAIVLAGVLLSRVILILLTIGSGYLFYHLALRKYGRQPVRR